MLNRWQSWLWLGAVLALSFLLRTHHAAVPLVDTSDWRQTDTAAIAYFYYHDGIRLLHPQLWHDGPGPDYTQLELQITPAITALLAHLFGFGSVLLHLVPDALFTLTVLPLWALVSRHLGQGVARFTVLAYVLLPLGVFFGRVFQPESAQVFFGVFGLWVVDRWALRRGALRYMAAVAVLALAVLAKLPNGMILPAAAALALEDRLWDWRAILRPKPLATVAGLTLLPAAAGAGYTLLQAHVSAGGTHYVNFIVTSLADPYIAGTSNLARFAWRDVLGMAITPAGLAAAVLGAVVLARRRAPWVWAWGLGILLYALVVLRAIRFQYYLMPLLPWLGLMMGLGLNHLAETLGKLAPRARLLPRLAAVSLLVSLLCGGLFQIRGFWPPYMPWYTAGVALNRTLPPNTTVILTGTFNPTLLYYAQRHGYRVNPLTMSELQADIQGGARFVLDQGGIDACMRAYLNRYFTQQDVGGVTVYRLYTPAPPPPSLPPYGPVPADATGNCAK